MTTLNGIAEWISGTWEGLRTRPRLRQIYTPVAAPGEPPSSSFIPERSYVTIRIRELRLAEAGALLNDYLPMCTCFLREGAGDAARTMPFVIGAEMIRSGLGANAPRDAGRNLAIHDMELVRHLPVRGQGLTLYSSLCHFKDDSVASGLLGFAAEAAKAVGGEGLAAPVRMAGDLTGKLQTLLGSGGVETRFARLDGDPLRQSGHYLLAASSEGIDGALSVRDGIVYQGDGAAARPLENVDYLLLEFGHLETLASEDLAFVSHLPFHKRYEQVEQEIIKSQGQRSPVADDLMIKLQQEIFASPALVARDRFSLTQIYLAARQKLESSFKNQFAAGEKFDAGTILWERERKASTPKVGRLIAAARGGLGQALRTERKAPAGTPTTMQDFAAIAAAVRAAGLPEDLPDNLFDLSEADRDNKLEAANLALETASLALTRAVLH
ncbi:MULTISPECIES: hypothetical protein [Bradyrhizobium]|uniref:hypothetical protein n=1 Tax=Bradyrhizobium TaxID=374 RepID=UPI0004BA8FD9|nr:MULTISPECIES: hypothetical protein [unclassified Bradyrhizobium]MDA9426432.1 hypothetical protein [Bradyrhizobium sp. CCBAU 53380]